MLDRSRGFGEVLGNGANFKYNQDGKYYSKDDLEVDLSGNIIEVLEPEPEPEPKVVVDKKPKKRGRPKKIPRVQDKQSTVDV